MVSTKYGPQPVKRYIAEGPLPLNRVAQAIGCTKGQLYHCVRGTCRPAPSVVKGLCDHFKAQAHDLFTEEILAQPYVRHRPVKVRAS